MRAPRPMTCRFDLIRSRDLCRFATGSPEYSRAAWERRFDVTVLRTPRAMSEGDAPSVAPWRALLDALDLLVRPVLAASGLFGENGADPCVEAVGCVLSLPRAPG